MRLIDADKLGEVLAEQPTIDTWVSVEDRLPEYWETVLWYDVYKRKLFVGWIFCTGFHGEYEITDGKKELDGQYWMPIPEPPEV